MDKRKNKYNYIDLIRIIPVILFAGYIFYLSSLSQPYEVEPPKGVRLFLNYILHIIEFAKLSFLAFF